LLIAACLFGQERTLDPNSSLKIDLPPDAPVALVQADVGQSRAIARGGAMILDLRMSLFLRNAASNRRIRGITLLVSAQEVTPGGRGSVAVPSLDIAPGGSFPVKIDLRLLRPLHAGTGPLVQVSLDGVLFEDLSFYGPNRLDSRRAMLVWEAEAERDRKHFLSILQTKGSEGLQVAALESLERQASRPRLDVEVARGRAVSDAATDRPELQFAFLEMPDAPVTPLEGYVNVVGNEARLPRIDVRNRSSRAIRHFEIGWLVRDTAGNQYWAASIPSSGPVPAGGSGSASQTSTLRFSKGPGQPVSIESMTGYVSQVEYNDGKVWIPERRALETHHLLKIVAPSAEEQRLIGIYRRKGLQGLIDELNRFARQ
jgi:hypothetical protein